MSRSDAESATRMKPEAGVAALHDPVLHAFADASALADALAEHVAAALAHGITRNGRAALAVSGGRTPQRFFAALSQLDIDWRSVDVTLVDERWVGEASERSNARLVREHLLQHRAAIARFVPLHSDDPTPEMARALIESRIAAMPMPFAAVVLGMGEDGHTASLFPQGDRLAEALDPASGRRIESMRATAVIEPRITLTLPAITQADMLALHIEGAAKRHVLETALATPEATAPIAAVLARSVHPPAVFWSP